MKYIITILLTTLTISTVAKAENAMDLSNQINDLWVSSLGPINHSGIKIGDIDMAIDYLNDALVLADKISPVTDLPLRQFNFLRILNSLSSLSACEEMKPHMKEIPQELIDEGVHMLELGCPGITNS